MLRRFESFPIQFYFDAGWSSSVARRAHNPKVVGSNPAPAISKKPQKSMLLRLFFFCKTSFFGVFYPNRTPTHHNLFFNYKKSNHKNSINIQIKLRSQKQILPKQLDLKKSITYTYHKKNRIRKIMTTKNRKVFKSNFYIYVQKQLLFEGECFLFNCTFNNELLSISF